GQTNTGSLNRIARDHVKHFLAIPQRAAGFALLGNKPGDEQIRNAAACRRKDSSDKSRQDSGNPGLSF
ncbi:MAG: hypothetical protein ACREFV_03265, partial [Acetobacteraceae bacterium]